MEKYFVPWEVAVHLSSKGFDEPCIAVYCNTCLEPVISARQLENGQWQTIKNSEVQRSELFISAPLYDQVFDWLESRGFKLMDYWIYIDKKVGCNVYEISTGKLLWPESHLMDGKYREGILYEDKREAWNTAIIEALKFINKNEETAKDKGTVG